MECFRCDLEAVQECPRCGALYCDDHGDALCERCMDPALAIPSYRVYRGSLLALLVGTAFAIWLLVRPPATTDAVGVPAPLAGVIATPVATAAPAAPQAATPVATLTPAPTATATATATPSATATPAPPAPSTRQHTVSEGDTLFSIAERYLPPGKDVLTFVEEIAATNDLSDANAIALGQVLEVPLQ